MNPPPQHINTTRVNLINTRCLDDYQLTHDLNAHNIRITHPPSRDDVLSFWTYILASKRKRLCLAPGP